MNRVFLFLAVVQAQSAPVISEGKTIQEYLEGVARVMVGAAYRVYRPNYGMHTSEATGKSESLLQYPYKFMDFLQFLEKSFGIVDNMVSMADQRYGIDVSLDGVRSDMQDLLREVNALQEQEQKMQGVIYSCDGPEQHQVMRDMVGSRVSVMCINPSFWQKFLHTVAKVCTVGRDVPLDAAAQLQWITDSKSELKLHATDVFAKLPEWTAKLANAVEADAQVDLVIRSYLLSRSYLASPLKLRERDEHRATSELSQYIPFLDSQLGTTHTSRGGMRVSFPYFLGYQLWGIMQTYAETVAKEPTAAGNKKHIADFFDWFSSFKYVHPCPFCMHHLTSEVQFTREADMYPIEYTLYNLPEDAQVCFDPKRSVKGYFQIDMAKKISTVLEDGSGRQFKLFLWTLHNAVSSSIGRKEAWYPNIKQVRESNRLEECGVEYTLRWWPRTELLQEFASLENHRKTLLDLYEGLEAAGPGHNVNCKNIYQDAKVQKIKAQVDGLLAKYGDAVAEQLARTYGLTKDAEGRGPSMRSNYDLDAMQTLQSCSYQLSDPLGFLGPRYQAALYI